MASGPETPPERTPEDSRFAPSPAVANPALWPFGTAKGPIDGWLRAQNPDRAAKIEDHGSGVRLYPPYAEGGPPRLVAPARNGLGLRCSGEGCEHAIEGCVHVWEDRFRFGDLKDGPWKAPIAVLNRKAGADKNGTDYEGYQRLLPRPNPSVNGRKYETIMRDAREQMPTEFPRLLAVLMRTLRREHAYADVLAGKKIGRGHPFTDVFDVALMAIIRIHERLAYEELAAQIDRYAVQGDDEGPFLVKWFDYARVIEGMSGWTKQKDPVAKAVVELRLSLALEEVRDRLLPLFRDLTTVVGCDGLSLSTAATDNARLDRTSRTRSRKVSLHVMYEIYWGIITAFRVTWHNRGLGSAESPQYPYLITTTKRELPRTKVVLGDGSYGSARNRALNIRLGVDLFCELKTGQFKGKTAEKWLTKEQIASEKARCGLENPVMRQVYPFRNRFEGWNEVVRNQYERNLISQADGAFYPPTKAERSAELLKENPVVADLELPEDQDEIERVIKANQWTGRAIYNEMLCRQIGSLVRAIVKCQLWYETIVDFACPKAFQLRPEDAERDIFRPRIDPNFVSFVA